MATISSAYNNTGIFTPFTNNLNYVNFFRLTPDKLEFLQIQKKCNNNMTSFIDINQKRSSAIWIFTKKEKEKIKSLLVSNDFKVFDDIDISQSPSKEVSESEHQPPFETDSDIESETA